MKKNGTKEKNCAILEFALCWMKVLKPVKRATECSLNIGFFFEDY